VTTPPKVRAIELAFWRSLNTPRGSFIIDS
jgi:hypothetical protein